MRQYIGYITGYSWCIITAFSMLLTSEISQSLGPFVVSFFTFFLATILFLVYNIARLKFLWQSIIQKRVLGLILAINISSFISWGLIIYPLTYLQPTLVATLILGISPIATVLINQIFIKQKSPKVLTGTSIALFLVIIFLSYRTLQGENSFPKTTQLEMMISLCCCYLSGIATSVNNILTKKIMVNDFGVIDLMCMRFYLTIIISGFIGFSTSIVIIDQDLILSIVLTTFVFVIIPLILIQITLKELDPLRTAIISPLMPVIVVLMQLYQGVSKLPQTTILAAIVTWILVCMGTYWSAKKI